MNRRPSKQAIAPAANTERSFTGGGEMGKVVRAKDWSRTSLGPIESWPPGLRTAVSLVLNSNFPIALAWGPRHVQLYNDGYWPICGVKHPAAMGQDFSECWASAFPVIGDAFRSALAGTAAFLEDQRMFLDRLGYLEETFFTFSFSPIRDERGEVAGLFHPVTETTGKMVGQRRTRTLRDLTAIGLEAQSLDEALRRTALILAEAAFDVPFALFYRLDEDRRTARLVAQTGLAPGGAASPAVVDLTHEDTGWPLARVAATRMAAAVDDVGTRFPGLVCGPYPEPIASARVQPIASPGHEGLPGLMVAGLSTRLPMNEAYGTFHELLATTVGHVAASALADEAKRRQAEALAEINQAKTDFFANISHEFRTPLTLMLGPLEDELGEQTSPLSAPRRERLATAHRNSMRLLKLVNSLLDFSRLEAGRAQASYQPTDLAALTTELAGMFRSAIEKARLTLVVDCPGLPEPVFVDREMWEKIVLNLVSNAFKHTFTGGIRVSLRWRGDHIELAVADSGVGIPADNVPHLFERFHRVKGARSRTHEGTGIGLALVHELIQLHGGTVRVESVPGQGSTFIATLKPGRAHLPDAHIVAAMPLEPSTRTAAYVEESLQWVPVVPAPSAGAVAAADADRARIVWADDNADMREYVHRLLGEFYTVTAVSNGTEAVAVSLAAPPDLVLTDIMMPGLDGFGVLRELRADVRTRHVPVILLSARAGEEAAVGGLKEGADDYLIKPFAARELLARVRTHLGLAKLRREWAAEQERTAELVRSEAEGRKLLETAEESRRALLGILEDQQRAEAAQQVSRETLRLMLDAAHIGYWDLDLVTHAAARSLRHDQIFGYEELQADWTYEKFLAHVHPEERERANRLFHAGVAAKTEWDFECRILRRDGTLCWVWVHGNVFTNAADEAVRMLGMVNDITKRKQAEEEIHRLNTGLEQRVAERTAQLEAANKELEAFSYSVSHDLRAPLRAVDGFSQAVLEDHGPQLPAEGQRQLQTIRQSAQQMGALINDLLAFSRLSRQELKKRPVDTGRLVHECLGELKLQQEGRRIETKVGELPPCSGDRALLKQVFLNLISNALKYSRKRDPAVIEIGCRQEKGLETYFVRDNGTGFDMRYAPKLFGVFQRLHRAEDYEGTGVGLAIVQRIVHRHGGRVWAEAAPDLGARFFFTLQEEAKS